MEFQQLIYFIEVARQRSFRGAALTLNISQPAVTKQIQILESELDSDLFDKEQRTVHKKVVLTDAGQFLFIEANKLIQSRKNIFDGIKKLNSRKKVIKVGVPLLFPRFSIIEILNFLKGKLNNVEIKLIEFNSFMEVEDALEKDEILLGFTSIGDEFDKFDYITFNSGNLQVYLHENHPLANSNSIQIHQLKNEKWIEINKNIHVFRDFLEKDFKKHGLSRENSIVQDVSSFELFLGLIQDGFGVGIAPSYFNNGIYKIKTVNLLIYPNSDKLVTRRQVIAFKKNYNSSIINSLL